MIILDTGGLYAALDGSERLHQAALTALAAASPPRLLSPFVLAELDYLLGSRVGSAAQHALLAEVAAGVYHLEPFSSEDVARAEQIMQQYSDLHLGLAGASVIILAQRHRALDLLCTDLRHFRALRGAGGRPFRLLPADG